MDNETQKKLILVWLIEYGTITAREAFDLCGCKNLCDRIQELRKIGIPITSEPHTRKNTAGNKVRFLIYKLEVNKC